MPGFRLERKNRYERRGTYRSARTHYVEELPTSAEPPISNPVHQFDLQYEVRALFLLGES